MLSETIARAGSANIAKMTSTAIPLSVECNCLMPSEIAMLERRSSEEKGGKEEVCVVLRRKFVVLLVGSFLGFNCKKLHIESPR